MADPPCTPPGVTDPFKKSGTTPRSPIIRSRSSPELVKSPRQTRAESKKVVDKQLKKGIKTNKPASIPSNTNSTFSTTTATKITFTTRSPPTHVSSPALPSTNEDKIPPLKTKPIVTSVEIPQYASLQKMNQSESALTIVQIATLALKAAEPLKNNITKEVRETIISSLLEIIKKGSTLGQQLHALEVELLKTKLQNAESQLKTEERHCKEMSAFCANAQKEPVLSYASAVGNREDRTRHAVIVSSSDQDATAESITSTIKDIIKPAVLRVGVSGMSKAKNNKVIITCPRKTDAEKILTEISKATTGSLKAQDGKLLRPTVILKGVAHEYKDEEILHMIIQQNDLIYEAIQGRKPEDCLKILRITKNRNEQLRNIVLIVDSTTRNALLHLGRINIGYMRVHVEDSSSLVQCFKCMGFGHSSPNCNALKDRCLHCAGEHKSMVCPKKDDDLATKCWNCSKTSSNKDVYSHKANSRQCPYRKKMEERAQQRTDYGK